MTLFGITIDTSILFVLFLSLIVILQIVFLAASRRIILRILPTAVLTLFTLAMYIMIYISEGWDPLGYLFLFIFSGIALGVCGIIWAIYGFIRLFRR